MVITRMFCVSLSRWPLVQCRTFPRTCYLSFTTRTKLQHLNCCMFCVSLSRWPLVQCRTFPRTCYLSFTTRTKLQHLNCCTEALNETQTQQVSMYIDTLLDWNQRMNLTAVTDRSSIMERHVADSLALLPVMESAYSQFNTEINGSENIKMVDVGTGAGLPGVILAIARPSWSITLMESLQKRCNFLEQVVEDLNLSNVKVVRARAEDAGHEAIYREVFDIAVARAVAEMRILVELCLPLVRVGGLLVAAKGANPEEEVKLAERAAKLLGGKMLPIEKVNSMSPHGQRTAVLCYKRQITAKKYPRKPGTPQKQPL